MKSGTAALIRAGTVAPPILPAVGGPFERGPATQRSRERSAETLTTPDFAGVVEHCAVMGVVVAGAVTWLSDGRAGT